MGNLRTSPHLRSQGSRLFLGLILLVYLISQISLLRKPGLQEDEGIFLLPSIELAHGNEITVGSSIDLLGLHYPAMIGGYTGNSLTIPVALAVRVFGFNLQLVRSLWVIVGAGTILFTYLVCRELFNRWVGVLASLLLSINPTFWMFTHVGAHASVSMTLDVMGSLFFFLCFYKTRKWQWLILAMFLTGHGLYTKLAFGYFLIAYFISFVYLCVRGKLEKSILTAQNLFTSLIAFLLGSWPLMYNILTSDNTLGFLRTALTGTSLSGQSNLNVGQNLLERVNQTWSYLLEGHIPINLLVPGSPVTYDLIMPYFFFGALVFLFASIFWHHRTSLGKESVAFILLVFCVFQLLIIFTPSTLNPAVFAFIPPFTASILAVAFYLLYKILSSNDHARLKWVAVVGIVLLATTEARTLSSQYDVLRSTGGRGVWSSTIFQLNDYLLQHLDRTVVALDWGLDHPISALSDLRIQPSTAYVSFTYENDVLTLWQDFPPIEFAVRMEDLIRQPQNIYLVRNERYAAFKNRFSTLRDLVQAKGRKLVKLYTIYETDGEEFMQVYEVQ